MEFITNPLPVKPVPCGNEQGKFLVKGWEASSGRCPGEEITGKGLSVSDTGKDYASFGFTFEAWFIWPEQGSQSQLPVVIAEASGEGWSWEFGFHEDSSLRLTFQSGDYSTTIEGELMADNLKSGTWYHAAVTLDDTEFCALYLTREGTSIAKRTGTLAKLHLEEPRSEKDVLFIINSSKDSSIYIGSAAFYSRVKGPADFPALGGAGLPSGISTDTDLEYGSLGNIFALSEDTIVFSSEFQEFPDYWFAFRIKGVKGKTLRFYHTSATAMGASIHLSEDNGITWAPPSGEVWREFRWMPYEGSILFSHTFENDEALISNSIIISSSAAETWIDETAEKFKGTIHEIGTSREGRPLRAVEIGNPDAPLVYLQAGQHSMMERLGYYLITSAFEQAAQDKDLLDKTRWLVMPIVNVDSHAVLPVDGNMNRQWDKNEDHPTIGPLSRFLKEQGEKTGAFICLDLHAGTVWRGHSLLCSSPLGESDPNGYDHRIKKESGYPDLEDILREEGLDYTVLNSWARDKNGEKGGFFSDVARELPGVKAVYTVELSSIAMNTPDGTFPVTIKRIQEDGIKWYKAIKRFLVSESGSQTCSFKN